MDNFHVIGSPISHSKSPLLFSYIFKTLNLNACYDKILIEDEQKLSDYIHDIKINKTLLGINITMPYKETVIQYLDLLTEEAIITKAVNCISIKNQNLIGHNTDIGGFKQLLIHHNINIKSNNYIIIGSGGSARAIIWSLINHNAGNIYILSRNNQTAKTLIDSFKPYLNKSTLQLLNDSFNSKFCNIINCTPIGMDQNIDTSILKHLPDCCYNIIIDINYNSTLNSFKHIKSRKINGNAMFIFQAIDGLKLWLDIDISNKLAYNELEKIIIDVK